MKLARFISRTGFNTVFEVLISCDARSLLFDIGLSKAVIGRLFTESCVLRLGSGAPEHIVSQTMLDVGDLVAVVSRITRQPCQQFDHVVPVIYEDPFIVAVDKPQGILVHSDGTGAATLTGCVQHYLNDHGEPWVSQAIQRLDIDTSGVVIFSKTEEWQGLFDAMIASDDIEKHYLAIVAGNYPGSAVYSDPIGRDRHDAKRMRVHSSGQPARTFVRRIAYNDRLGCSLLDVRLGTGRRHQIRVHLAAHGFPVLNDPLYGSHEAASGLMLHASWESFKHPVMGTDVVACAPWPERFSAYFSPVSTAPCSR